MNVVCVTGHPRTSGHCVNTMRKHNGCSLEPLRIPVLGDFRPVPVTAAVHKHGTQREQFCSYCWPTPVYVYIRYSWLHSLLNKGGGTCTPQYAMAGTQCNHQNWAWLVTCKPNHFNVLLFNGTHFVRTSLPPVLSCEQLVWLFRLYDKLCDVGPFICLILKIPIVYCDGWMCLNVRKCFYKSEGATNRCFLSMCKAPHYSLFRSSMASPMPLWLHLIAGSWPLNCEVSLSLSPSHIGCELIVHGRKLGFKELIFKVSLILLGYHELMRKHPRAAALCSFSEVWTAFINPNIYLKKKRYLHSGFVYMCDHHSFAPVEPWVLLVCLASIVAYLLTHLELHTHKRQNFMARNHGLREGNVCHAR